MGGRHASEFLLLFLAARCLPPRWTRLSAGCAVSLLLSNRLTRMSAGTHTDETAAEGSTIKAAIVSGLLNFFRFVDANTAVMVQAGIGAARDSKNWVTKNTTAEMWAGLLLLLGLFVLLSGPKPARAAADKQK